MVGAPTGASEKKGSVVMREIAGWGIILLCCACAEGQITNTPIDANNLNVDVEFLPENPEGEYAMLVETSSWICQGEVSQWPLIYAIASVVEQDNNVADILSRGVYGFADFAHWDVEIQNDGYFEDEYSFEFPLTPDYPPADITVSAAGSVVANSLAFNNDWLAGWYDADDVFHTECEISFANTGWRRYVNWQNEPRPSPDGQWRVWRETLEDSIVSSLPEGRWQTLDTIAQDDDGSIFDLKGRGFSIKNIPRGEDGGVTETFWFGNSWLDVYGQVENNYFDLEITWEIKDPVTNKLLWRIRERYTGVPRFAPHVPKQPEPVTGTFNADIAEVFDSCVGELESHNYVIEVLPASPAQLGGPTDNEQFQLWVGSLKPPPFSPDAVGKFAFGFERLDGWLYRYRFSEGEINGDSISFMVNEDVLWPDSGALVCSVLYTVSGDKRYQSWFPNEQEE